MKKISIMMAALAMFTVACGGNKQEKSDVAEASAENTEVTTEKTEPAAKAATTASAIMAGDGIAVFQASRAFDSNQKHGILSVSFKDSSTKKTLKFESDYDNLLPAAEWGFSSETAKITKFVVGMSTLDIYYEATEENYGEAVDITYKPNAAHPIKDKEGREIKGFTAKLPYTNVDLI